MKVEVEVFSWTEERDETRGDRSHLHSYHSYRGIDYLSERAKRVCVRTPDLVPSYHLSVAPVPSGYSE